MNCPCGTTITLLYAAYVHAICCTVFVIAVPHDYYVEKTHPHSVWGVAFKTNTSSLSRVCACGVCVCKASVTEFSYSMNYCTSSGWCIGQCKSANQPEDCLFCWVVTLYIFAVFWQVQIVWLTVNLWLTLHFVYRNIKKKLKDQGNIFYLRLSFIKCFEILSKIMRQRYADLAFLTMVVWYGLFTNCSMTAIKCLLMNAKI